jgi:hypothetical protein
MNRSRGSSRSPLKTQLPFIAILLSSTLLSSGCGGETGGPEGTSVVDSAGVTLVTGPGEDRPLEWSAERVLQIQPLQEEGEGFFGVTDLGVLSGHRIAVLDGDAKRIVVFDEAGKFLVQYGREGSGPGEFQYPLELAPRPDGGVSVFDMMNRRLERFDEALFPQAPDPLQGVSYFGGGIAFAGSFMVLPTVDYSLPAPRPQTLMAMGRADTLELVRYIREQGGTITLESCGMRLSGIEPIFAPRLLWAPGPDGWVAVVGTDRYEVDLYHPPEFSLVRRIRRQVPTIQATEAMAQATVGDGMRMMSSAGVRICDAAEVVEKRGFAPEVPPVAAVAISPEGEIFLQRWAPEGEDRVIDVLTPDGEYLGTTAPGFPFPEAFLGHDRMVVSERDELDLASVAVYRITRDNQ